VQRATLQTVCTGIAVIKTSIAENPGIICECVLGTPSVSTDGVNVPRDSHWHFHTVDWARRNRWNVKKWDRIPPNRTSTVRI
jgi:hypothetical protein